MHDLDPVLLPIGGAIGIRWYGLAYAAAFLISGWLLRVYHRRGRSPLNEAQQSNFLLACMLGVLVGGRLGYILLYDPQTLRRISEIFAIWNGGMASHGGFVGVIAAVAWCARSSGMGFLRLGDLVVTLTPPGLLLGRLANFINGELWGTPTNGTWGVKFPTEILSWSQAKLDLLSARLSPNALPATSDWPFIVISRIQSGDAALRDALAEALRPRHPSQLYEAALEGLFLLGWTQWRLWRTRVLEYPGRLAGEFLLLYGVVRVLGEQFREPDADLIFGMSRGVFYSLFLMAGGLALLARSRLPGPAPRA